MTGLRLVGADRRRELEARREHVSSERRLRASDAARWGAVPSKAHLASCFRSRGQIWAARSARFTPRTGWWVGGLVTSRALGGSHIPSGGMPYARARSLMPVRSVAHNRATSVP